MGKVICSCVGPRLKEAEKASPQQEEQPIPQPQDTYASATDQSSWITKVQQKAAPTKSLNYLEAIDKNRNEGMQIST